MAKDCDVSLGMLDMKINALTDSVHKCETLLSGNGTPERGVIVRLDRLEQMLGTQKKFTWAFLSAIGLPWVFELFKKVTQ